MTFTFVCYIMLNLALCLFIANCSFVSLTVLCDKLLIRALDGKARIISYRTGND